MKTLITFLTIFMLFLSTIGIAASPPVPNPIIGKLTLNGQGLDGYVITITNLGNGKSVSGATIPSLITEKGGFFVDLSKVGFVAPIPSIGFAGHTIRASVNGLSDPQATIDFIPDPTPYRFQIAIVNTQTVFVCSDGSTVVDVSDCPVEEEEVEDAVDDSSETETKVTTNSDKSSASSEINYGQLLSVSLNDNKLSVLLDEEISYDGEKYDIHEEISFKGIVRTSIDDEDYGLNPYLNIEEEDVVYKYVFEETIPYEDFHIEEPLEIVFLGKELKIIEASATEIILRTGQELFLQEGQSKIIEEKKVEVITIGENSVLISIDGIQKTVSDGENRLINGLRVLVDSILYKSYAGANNAVELVVGSETDEVVKNGDDFELFIEDDETWTWMISLGIDQQFIGITNQERYVSIDEDEEFKAIGIGESLNFPNNYVSISFDSVSEFDMTELTFKVREKNNKDYLYVKGDSDDAFNFASKDYDRLFIDSTGIYDEDLELITTDKLEIGDSNIFLELGSIIIANLKIELDMTDILFKSLSFSGKEESFLDYLGILFIDPENAVEDKTGFDVSVPEDRPEALIVFEFGLVIIDEPVVDEEEEEEGDTGVVKPIDDEVIPPVTPPVTPPVSPPTDDDEKVIPPVEPESKIFETLTYLLGLILAALGVKWRAGFLGLAKYHWNKGNKMTALKMLITATKRAKEDYYKKR